MLDTDVFEFHPHWLACMKLQGQLAIEQGLFGSGVGKVQNQSTVHEVLNVVAFGDDDDVVPIIEFEQLGPFLRGHEVVRYLFAIFVPYRLFAGETNASAFAAFIVNEASDVRHFGFISYLMLIATNDPWISRIALGDVLGTILDSGIVGRVAAKRYAQFKIFGSSILPD